MAAVLAWVYTVAPVRLCNSYLASDQKMLGTGMAVLVGVLANRWGASAVWIEYRQISRCTLATQQPAYRAFIAVKREGQDDLWPPIGTAFAYEKGDGFNVILQAAKSSSGLRRPRGSSCRGA